MKDIFLAHARRYPKMEPRDAVKLLYQSLFGGGHLIHDEAACLQQLFREYAAREQEPDLPLLEEIGGGLVRVFLGSLEAHGYAVSRLGQDFIRSASFPRSGQEGLADGLSLLRALTDAGQMPFSTESLAQYLEEYEQAGFPMVSHSETYREAYRPAYRIVDVRCLPEEIAKLRMP